jgi:hypothetical protein
VLGVVYKLRSARLVKESSDSGVVPSFRVGKLVSSLH